MKSKHSRLLLVSTAFLSLTASAAAVVWTGTSSGNWSVGANWGGTAPVASNPLDFTGVMNTATVNDIAAGTKFGLITFDNTTSGGEFLLIGNGILLSGGIATTGSTGSPVHRIGIELKLDGARTITTELSNDLIVSGIISQTGGSRSLTKNGAGALTLAAANTYSGNTNLNEGVLVVGSNTAVGSGKLAFGGGNLQSDGTARTLANSWSVSGNGGAFGGASALTLAGDGVLSSSGTLFFENSGLTTLSGPFSISNSTTARMLTLSGSGDVLWSGALIDAVGAGSSTGAGKLIMKGSGTLTLAGDNAYSGGTSLDATHTGTVILSGANSTPGPTSVLSGALGIGNDSALGSSKVLLGSSGGVVSSSVFAAGGARSIGNEVILGTATGAVPSITGSNALTIQGAVRLSGGSRALKVDNSGGTTLAGGVFLSDSATSGRTFTINGAGALTISGQVADFDGSGVAGNLVYSGSGVLTLSAANSYTGTTTLTAGMVAVGDEGALGTGTLVFNGGSLQASGGPHTIANEFRAGANGGVLGGTHALTLAGNGNLTASSTLTFHGPAMITISGVLSITNNSTARTLTLDGSDNSFWSGMLTDGTGSPGVPTGNSGKGSLIKTGSGTATFSGNNTYTGKTEITAGTLVLAAGSMTSAIKVESGAFLGFKVGSPVTSTAAVNLVAGSAIRINGTPTLANHVLITAASISGTPVLAAPVPGYVITTSGNSISLTSTGVVGNYATWAAANGIPGEPASGDFDNDGLSNLVEYALGTHPKTSSPAPAIFAGGTVTFTKGADAIANGDVDLVIEESDDLGISDAWTAVVSHPAPNASTTISHTLPTGKAKVFVRLKVTQRP